MYAGEGNKNMPGYVLHTGGIRICPDMFCMRRNKNMPRYVLHAGGMKICLDMFCMRGNAEKIKNCEIGSDVWLCYTGIKSFAG